MKEYKIDKNAAGQRIDRYLTKRFPMATKGFLQKMLRKKRIKLNGQRADAGQLIKLDDCIQVYFSDETIAKFSEAASSGPEIPPELYSVLEHPIHRDSRLLVINKPVGLLTQPDGSGSVSVSDLVSKPNSDSTFRLAPANRLDKNTSGVILIPLDYPTQKEVLEFIRNRKIIKEYYALVSKTITTSGRLSHHLIKDEKSNTVKVTRNQDGVLAELEYTPIASHGNTTILKITLLTGRTHQIRVQLAAEGMPIIGDPKYGNFKINNQYRKSFGLNHQLLHSHRYAIPELNIDFEAPLPEDYRALIKNLGYHEVH